MSNPAINANTGKAVRGRVVFDSQTKTDMPAVRRKADCGVIGLADKLAGIPKLDPTDFGKANLRPLAIQLADVFTDLTTLKAERIIQAPFSGTGIFGNTFEEVAESSVQVSQSLLLACLTNGGYPVVFGSKIGQFAGLSDIVKVLASVDLEVAPVVAALFKGNVVDQAAYTSKLTEQDMLLPCWVQFVTIAALDHVRIISIGLWENNMEYRTGRHVVYMLHVHLVFVTKYRRNVLSDLAIHDLHRIFEKVCQDFEAELVECDGEDDHVHLLVNYPPKVALSKLVNSLKGVSSRRIREIRPEIIGRYRQGVLWSPSYFAGSCGGAPLSVIAEYVNSQRKPSSGRSRIPPRPEGRGIQRGSR